MAVQHLFCNHCLTKTKVEFDYFSFLDSNGRRIDLNDRYELQNGSIEYILSNSNFNKFSSLLCWLFVIDVSNESYASGTVKSSCKAIREVLYTKSGAI